MEAAAGTCAVQLGHLMKVRGEDLALPRAPAPATRFPSCTAAPAQSGGGQLLSGSVGSRLVATSAPLLCPRPVGCLLLGLYVSDGYIAIFQESLRSEILHY